MHKPSTNVSRWQDLAGDAGASFSLEVPAWLCSMFFHMGLIVWLARNFEGRYAVRSVLIASVLGLAVNIVINVWATLQGWLNAKAWGSTVVLLLLLLGGLYELSQRLFDERS